ncbi:MAG: hypothetical protein LBU09_03760 [Endomicrobium sp.]|jgi:hypothetical protein|nr:hypothetical protein [Endomicrobium sp.]
MRKLILSLAAVAFVTGSALASQVNFNLGYDLAGSMSASKNASGSMDVNSGINLGAEYLFSTSRVFKIGGGLKYLLARETDPELFEFSYLPIYLAVQWNPMGRSQEGNGLFFRGNLGYNIFSNNSPSYEARYGSQTDSGGIYLGFGAGWEFSFGLVVSLSYDLLYGSSKFGVLDVGYSYGKTGLNVGYKLNI